MKANKITNSNTIFSSTCMGHTEKNLYIMIVWNNLIYTHTHTHSLSLSLSSRYVVFSTPLLPHPSWVQVSSSQKCVDFVTEVIAISRRWWQIEVLYSVEFLLIDLMGAKCGVVSEVDSILVLNELITALVYIRGRDPIQYHLLYWLIKTL
jgi:hypothetical protein